MELSWEKLLKVKARSNLICICRLRQGGSEAAGEGTGEKVGCLLKRQSSIKLQGKKRFNKYTSHKFILLYFLIDLFIFFIFTAIDLLDCGSRKRSFQ